MIGLVNILRAQITVGFFRDELKVGRKTQVLIRALKTITKLLIATLFYYSGLFYLVRIINNVLGRRLTIVTYHRVTDKRLEQIEHSLPFLFVTEDTFTKQLRFFKKHYNIITFKDLEHFEKNVKVPSNSLIITFDDGYEDNFLRAYPILKRHDLSSVIFLATDMIGGNEIPWWDQVFARLNALSDQEIVNDQNSQITSGQLPTILEEFKKDPSKLFLILNTWERSEIDRLLESLTVASASSVSDESIFLQNRFLRWEQVKEMQGTMEFGSHTCSHIQLDGLSIDAIRTELTRSKQELEKKLGNKVHAFSYPAGSYTAEAKRLVAECRYSFGVTTNRGLNDVRDKYALKRINIWEGTCSAWGKFSKALLAFRLAGF